MSLQHVPGDFLGLDGPLPASLVVRLMDYSRFYAREPIGWKRNSQEHRLKRF